MVNTFWIVLGTCLVGLAASAAILAATVHWVEAELNAD